MVFLQGSHLKATRVIPGRPKTQARRSGIGSRVSKYRVDRPWGAQTAPAPNLQIGSKNYQPTWFLSLDLWVSCSVLFWSLDIWRDEKQDLTQSLEQRGCPTDLLVLVYEGGHHTSEFLCFFIFSDCVVYCVFLFSLLSVGFVFSSLVTEMGIRTKHSQTATELHVTFSGSP